MIGSLQLKVENEISDEIFCLNMIRMNLLVRVFYQFICEVLKRLNFHNRDGSRHGHLHH